MIHKGFYFYPFLLPSSQIGRWGRIGDGLVISLNLEEILGKPLSQEDKVTGSGYTEFCKKILEFDGLQITLYENWK